MALPKPPFRCMHCGDPIRNWKDLGVRCQSVPFPYWGHGITISQMITLPGMPSANDRGPVVYDDKTYHRLVFR